MVPRRMLIVDDEQDICDCLAQYFGSKGFEVAKAFSGEQALERLSSDHVDVLLLDILLPGISGLEVLRRAKELQPRVRVIMVSGHDLTEFREGARQRGACGFVPKPFDFSERTWSPVLVLA